jgi:hypothetical protein
MKDIKIAGDSSFIRHTADSFGMTDVFICGLGGSSDSQCESLLPPSLPHFHRVIPSASEESPSLYKKLESMSLESNNPIHLIGQK